MQSHATGNVSTQETLSRAAISGAVCAIVSCPLNPLDVIKVRLQLQKKGIANEYTGMLSGIKRIYKEEGLFRGLGKGLGPSMLRELSYSSVRIGAYEPIRAALCQGISTQDSSPLVKFFSGFLSGGIGAAIANPFDLVKTRFQSVLAHEVAPYTSTLNALKSIAIREGVKGLYKGWPVTSTRAAVVTSAQMGSYDTIKNNILKKRIGLQEGFSLHFISSMLAGIITVWIFFYFIIKYFLVWIT